MFVTELDQSPTATKINFLQKQNPAETFVLCKVGASDTDRSKRTVFQTVIYWLALPRKKILKFLLSARGEWLLFNAQNILLRTPMLFLLLSLQIMD